VGKTKNAPGEMRVPPIDKFPAQLYRDVKSLAAQKGTSIKDIMIQALRYVLENDYVVKGKPIGELAHESGKEEVRRDPEQTDSSGTRKARRR
jgi:hypothetical protein